jgi:hypothetical protein
MSKHPVAQVAAEPPPHEQLIRQEPGGKILASPGWLG